MPIGVVVDNPVRAERPLVAELLPLPDQLETLRRDAFLVLDLGLDRGDGVAVVAIREAQHVSARAGVHEPFYDKQKRSKSPTSGGSSKPLMPFGSVIMS